MQVLGDDPIEDFLKFLKDHQQQDMTNRIRTWMLKAKNRQEKSDATLWINTLQILNQTLQDENILNQVRLDTIKLLDDEKVWGYCTTAISDRIQEVVTTLNSHEENLLTRVPKTIRTIAKAYAQELVIKYEFGNIHTAQKLLLEIKDLISFPPDP
ncbi:hypothetical protein SK355_10990 [Candidatus Fukatsuia symbiotica]|uniref:Uncharacterized protein n=2 Tax=Candidatus Fukatsuia symbiotica TaxID=1878942 RepID=A0A2U8I7N7_9GAMM|nr:hypothetical protein [Candidatus Fukatsuia symbiotica]AWK13944.1 hypothetical protein CCS41_04780 [Candidatus Fukatsuia symbiotica]MEA9445713.1 hypothetical protein [Candidatus Fukatsuia symbiotica]